MQKIGIILGLLFINLNGNTQVESVIESVTVFRNQAEINRLVTVDLPKGTHEIIVKDISTLINPMTVQMHVENSSIEVLSAVYESTYREEVDADSNQANQVDSLLHLIKLLDEESMLARTKIGVYNDLLDALDMTRNIGKEVDYRSGKLDSIITVYQQRHFEYKEQIHFLTVEQRKINDRKTKLNEEISALTGQVKPYESVLRLMISKPYAGEAKLECSYLVSQAGWSPLYDLRSDGINQNVELQSKANVYQNTGNDWSDVGITISTRNPLLSNQLPNLNPSFLDFQIQAPSAQEVDEALRGEVAGLRVTAINGKIGSSAKFSQNGYAYDATVSDKVLSVEYQLENQYTIPSNGKSYLVGVNEYSLPSVYHYRAIPKLDQHAFLLAKVSDYGQYNLLPAQANIYFQDAYVGKTSIYPITTKDSLTLSMGRDDRIQVKRTKLEDFTAKTFLGGQVKELLTYQIEIRNNKGHSIDLELLDQVPVSNQKDIKIEIEELSNAKLNEETGELKWNMKLLPNETRTILFSYTIKYPKDKPIVGAY